MDTPRVASASELRAGASKSVVPAGQYHRIESGVCVNAVIEQSAQFTPATTTPWNACNACNDGLPATTTPCNEDFNYDEEGDGDCSV
jgi:hypothetical protein